MITHSDSYLSSYVREVLIELAELGVDEDSSVVDNPNVKDNQYLTSELLLNWGKISRSFGNFSDDFNILSQSTEWYKLMLRKVWKIVHVAGKALMNSTIEQRTELWKLCENLNPIVDLDKCFKKFISNKGDSKLQVLLILTSSLERFLGNVYLVKGQNVPFLLRDLLLTEELLSVFGRIPITFTQLLVGCPLGLNLRNVAWHGFLSSREINCNLVASLFILFASLDSMIRELNLVVPERNTAKLNSLSNLLKGELPDLSVHISNLKIVLNDLSIIPNSHKIFWQESFNSYETGRYDECLIVILPQLEHFLRLIYCSVNSCPYRLLTAEATDLYTTLDEILAPPTEDCSNRMLEFLGLNLTEALEDILCYPEGPRIRDKISHGEFNLFNTDNFHDIEVFCNHICCIGLCCILVASQRFKLNSCASCTLPDLNESNRRESEINCKCEEFNRNIERLQFLETSILSYKSKFHPVSYLLRSVHNELNKLMLWNQLPRPCEYPYTDDNLSKDVSCLKSFIVRNVFGDQMVYDSDGFYSKLFSYLEDINCLTLHRPRNEGIMITLLRHIVYKVNKLNCTIKETSDTKYNQWNERKMRSRSRLVYKTMLQFLPSLQSILLCLIFIILYETKYINQIDSSNCQQVKRFLKYTLKYIENILSYCHVDKNQWHEVTKLTSEFSNCASDYLDVRFKSSTVE